MLCNRSLQGGWLCYNNYDNTHMNGCSQFTGGGVVILCPPTHHVLCHIETVLTPDKRTVINNKFGSSKCPMRSVAFLAFWHTLIVPGDCVSSTILFHIKSVLILTTLKLWLSYRNWSNKSSIVTQYSSCSIILHTPPHSLLTSSYWASSAPYAVLSLISIPSSLWT